MKKNLKGEIVSIAKVCDGVYEFKIKSNLEQIKPGQFYTILCPPKILRRPFGTADFFKNPDGTSTLCGIVKLRGDGTKYLSTLKIGDSVEFNAPLGNGFNIENKKSLMIGAGVGVAPLLYLKKILNEKGIENLLISGYKSDQEVIPCADFVRVGGTILDDIEEKIAEFKPEKIYTCAPTIVLKLATEIAQRHGLDCEVAMEKTMACAMGVCRSCVIEVKKGDAIKNATVCSDGPVFLGSEVVW